MNNFKNFVDMTLEQIADWIVDYLLKGKLSDAVKTIIDFILCSLASAVGVGISFLVFLTVPLWIFPYLIYKKVKEKEDKEYKELIKEFLNEK